MSSNFTKIKTTLLKLLRALLNKLKDMKIEWIKKCMTIVLCSKDILETIKRN